MTSRSFWFFSLKKPYMDFCIIYHVRMGLFVESPYIIPMPNTITQILS